MARTSLTLTVIKDTCLGHEVFRGSVDADSLLKASWIDFHDPDSNPHGYQRPFDINRSRQAANYANTVENAFWPECILAMRNDEDETEEDEKVSYEFRQLSNTSERFGTLRVSYDDSLTIHANGEEVPWRRAFSQVDCQHRLGTLAGSSRLVTFCIFPQLSRREEAIIFRTINGQQRRVSTSLVDAIILLTDPQASVHIRWAWDLGHDVGSPFYQRVNTGGRGRPSGSYLVNLAGLRQTLEVLMPRGLLYGEDPDLWYVFVRNFWTVVKDLWPAEFTDRTRYKLQSTACLRGLSQFGQHIFRKGLPTQDTSQPFIRNAFEDDGTRMDWAVGGPLLLATGKGGQRQVYQEIVSKYGVLA